MPNGLIDTQMDLTNDVTTGNGLVTDPNATGYNADTTRVRRGTDTAAGQLDSLLADDSTYLQRARAGATQTANSRGLLNSSMAAGAGEAAAIDAALPIAAHDADTFSTTRLTNQAATNTARGFNANATNTAALASADASNALGRIAASGDQNVRAIHAQGGETRETQAQGGDIQARIETLRGQIQTGLIGEQGSQTRMTDAQQAEAAKELATLQGRVESRHIRQTMNANLALSAADREKQLAVQGLRGDQATTLAGIEANYKNLIQANASAGSYYQTFTNNMMAVMADPNLSAEQKQAGVDKLTQLLQGNLAMVGAIANIDLSGTLDFTTP